MPASGIAGRANIVFDCQYGYRDRGEEMNVKSLLAFLLVIMTIGCKGGKKDIIVESQEKKPIESTYSMISERIHDLDKQFLNTEYSKPLPGLDESKRTTYQSITPYDIVFLFHKKLKTRHVLLIAI